MQRKAPPKRKAGASVFISPSLNELFDLPICGEE